MQLSDEAVTTPEVKSWQGLHLVPVLVHDGVVHVESNDIMEYLDELPSPMPPFFPQNASERARVRESLALEDSLHMDLQGVYQAVW